jgi:hypothetical protein
MRFVDSHERIPAAALHYRPAILRTCLKVDGVNEVDNMVMVFCSEVVVVFLL